MSDTSAYPKAMTRLISFFSRLPGIGKRTAERLALALVDWPEEDLRQFGSLLGELRERVKLCRICGNLADGDECTICRDPRRDRETICVVESASQIPVLEKSGCYRGLYHVLGGRLAPLDGKGPEDLTIADLVRRVSEGQVREIILATSSDVEGEATAAYIADEFDDIDVTVTRIASGVPVGADLSYADAATLASALGGRRSLR